MMSGSEEKRYKLISGYCRKESDDMNIIDDIIPIIVKMYSDEYIHVLQILPEYQLQRSYHWRISLDKIVGGII